MSVFIKVPNFDDPSFDVTISKWNKKVGDKINKGEEIAIVETFQISCDIIADIDGFLAEILVEEGQITNMGKNIAVAALADTNITKNKEHKINTTKLVMGKENTTVQVPNIPSNQSLEELDQSKKDNTKILESISKILSDKFSKIEDVISDIKNDIKQESQRLDLLIADKKEDVKTDIQISKNNQDTEINDQSTEICKINDIGYHSEIYKKEKATTTQIEQPNPQTHTQPETGEKQEIISKKIQNVANTKHNLSEEEKKIIYDLIQSTDTNRPEIYADTWNKPTYFSNPTDTKIPFDKVRQKIINNIKENMTSAVVSSVSNEIDMTSIINIGNIFGNQFEQKYNLKLGFTPFFIAASVQALKKFPIFNSYINNDEIICKGQYNISIVTKGKDGLAYPVIKDADKKSISDLQQAIMTFSQQALNESFTIDQVSGGTFTLANAGIYGSLIGTNLLSSQQSATISMHRVQHRPVVKNGGNTISACPMAYVSLSYDHRIADTKEASEFLNIIKDMMENPGWQALNI